MNIENNLNMTSCPMCGEKHSLSKCPRWTWTGSKEGIIHMAEQSDAQVFDKNIFNEEVWTFNFEGLKRFAALVIANNPPQSYMSWQEGYAAGVAIEREACAKLVEEYWEIDGTQTAKEFAAVIRARGEK